MRENTNRKSKKAEKPSRLARKNGGFGRAVLAVLALVLALAAAAALYVVMNPEPVTFTYRDRILEAKPGVPVNRYDREGFAVDERGRVSYSDNGRRAKEGIDVSFYQGEIEWQAVAADGVEFAMIRLGYRGYTEGTLQFDSRFAENIRGAAEAGLEVGVYFFSQAITPEEAEEEADFVLKALEGYEITYPVAFDWEPITPGKDARTDGLDGETLTQCAAAFCRRVEQAGYEPVVYLNQEMGYLLYDLSLLTDWPFWLAEYDSAPDFYYDFMLWQYTHTGTVDGIQGKVDWNLDLRPAVN